MSSSEHPTIIEVGERVKMRFAAAETDLLHVLSFPSEIEELTTQEYFQKHQNNFHLRLHVEQDGRSSYAKDCPEIADFFATEEGRDIAQLSTYQRIIANQRDLGNFFGPLKQGNYADIDLIGYLLKIIEQNISTLSKVGITIPESILHQLTGENLIKQINAVSEKKKATLLVDTDGAIKRFNDKDLSNDLNVLNEVLTDILGKLTKQEHNNLLFLVYKKFLFQLLGDKQNKELQSMINNQNRDELQTYIENRYFR